MMGVRLFPLSLCLRLVSFLMLRMFCKSERVERSWHFFFEWLVAKRVWRWVQWTFQSLCALLSISLQPNRVFPSTTNGQWRSTQCSFVWKLIFTLSNGFVCSSHKCTHRTRVWESSNFVNYFIQLAPPSSAHSLMLYNRFSSILFHAKPIFTGNRWTHSISYSSPHAPSLSLSSLSLTRSRHHSNFVNVS